MLSHVITDGMRYGALLSHLAARYRQVATAAAAAEGGTGVESLSSRKEAPPSFPAPVDDRTSVLSVAAMHMTLRG